MEQKSKMERNMFYNILFYLVGTAGFEPATHGLKGRASPPAKRSAL